jgi:hypothetical protein
MLRYGVLVFSVESKLETKLVLSPSCRLGIARDTKKTEQAQSVHCAHTVNGDSFHKQH